MEQVSLGEFAANAAAGDGLFTHLHRGQSEGKTRQLGGTKWLRHRKKAPIVRLFYAKIVSDPKAVPNVMLLYGDRATPEAGHDASISVPTSPTMSRSRSRRSCTRWLPRRSGTHGGVTLWVKKDAQLIYKMAPAAEALAHYSAGAIGGVAAGDRSRSPGRTILCRADIISARMYPPVQ